MNSVADAHIPVKRSDLVTVEADGNLLVHYPGLFDAISLNVSARAILDLCDGQRSVAQLSHELAEETGYPSDVMMSDVKCALAQLSKFGIVTLEG